MSPQRVLLRDDTLYVLELGTEASGYTDGALASAGIDGGSPVRLLTGLAAPHALAGDGDAVYIGTSGTSQDGFQGSVLRRADNGELGTLAVNQGQVAEVAVDEIGVCWTADTQGALRCLAR